MRRTRLVLVLPDGEPLRGEGGHIIGIDLSRVPNDNPAAPIMVSIQQQCDMEDWHPCGRIPLPGYDLQSFDSTEVLELAHERGAARGG